MSHEIELSMLVVYQPYEGQLAGWPSPEEAVHTAKERAAKLMGDSIPIHVIEPELFTSHPAVKDGRQPPVIHKWCHIARFDGPPLNEEDDGSSLIFIWFSPTPNEDPRLSLEGISWKEHAKGWIF